MARHPKTTPIKNLTDDRILDQQELLARIPLDRSTVWRMCRDGRFPPPIQLTSNRIGWRLSAVLHWLEEREAEPIKARTFFNQDKATPTDAV